MIYCLVDCWTLSFSPDGKSLVSGSHTGKVNIFSVDSGKKESTLDTRGKFTMSVSYVCTLHNIRMFTVQPTYVHCIIYVCIMCNIHIYTVQPMYIHCATSVCILLNMYMQRSFKPMTGNIFAF